MRQKDFALVLATLLTALLAVLLAALLTLLSVPATAAAAPAGSAATPSTVRVVADEAGAKLQVDGRDFMVFGMNWGYMPIGENYLYSLWSQPDDVIVEALSREMPLLQDMGVNAIRQYAGIPPRWVRYIYEHYGIYTVINHPVARYGYTLDGVWIPGVDYADPRLRAALIEEITELVEQFRDTPGVLMWLLGNENNYGLSWTTFEAEALPEGEQQAARARELYSLFGEITDRIKELDTGRPVAIANGDVQYIDIIAQECPNIDVFGANVYRGISARDLFDVVREKLGRPVMFTEFGSDAYNAREMREDQAMQARYLTGQWEEIYEQSYGKGRAGNAIGGFIFQWSDGWWKFGQDSRLEIHDTNASWPNGGYDDYVEGSNNMNEEWWGITAKGPPDQRGIYDVYPRAAFYALRTAFRLDPYAPGTDLGAIRAHFHAIRPMAKVLEARGNRAALESEARERVHLAGLRMELETYSTGGERTTTPKKPVAGSSSLPAFRGFDHLESYYVDFEARPSQSVTGNVSLNILGNVPENPIDEIFYENRVPRITSESQQLILDRVRVYRSSISWDDRWFRLDGFYRTGHLHWGFEGDFFGIYRDAYYGENLDIYNGLAPLGFEIAGKRDLTGLKLAFGPQLWWGANPAFLVKYNHDVGPFAATAIYQEDIAPQSRVTTSIAVPEPENRKLSLQLKTTYGHWTFEAGGLWSGSTKLDEKFRIADRTAAGYRLLQDEVKFGDTFGAKAKVTWEKGRWHWYAQAAAMGLVADGGPTQVITFTGWNLKDTGMGNQRNVLTGVAYNVGNFQLAPNFLWQEPYVGPVPGVADPGGALIQRPRNIVDDAFAVLGNRKTVGAEFLVTWDPTPATWMWAWDNDVREDARLAAAVGLVYRDQQTTRDASIYVSAEGDAYPFLAAPPAQELWEIHARIVSRLAADTRLVANLYAGMGEPNGWDPQGLDPSLRNTTLDRFIHRWGLDARVTHGPLALAGFAKFNDWGPYDYHRDFNLTFPVQLMGDLSYSLGQPRWFGFPQTRLGVRGTWRSLDENTPRYNPIGPDDESGNEWEIRTYLHLAL